MIYRSVFLLLVVLLFSGASQNLAHAREMVRNQVVVDIRTQTFVFYDNRGGNVHKGEVTTARKGFVTPRGTFPVLGKHLRPYSKKYKAYMPYAVEFVKSKYLLHQGTLVADTAKNGSHGCVRVSRSDARMFYDKLQIGDHIVIR